LNKLSQDVPSQPSIVSFSSALQKFSRKYFLSHGTPAVTDVVVHRRIFTEESKAIIFKFFSVLAGQGRGRACCGFTRNRSSGVWATE